MTCARAVSNAPRISETSRRRSSARASEARRSETASADRAAVECKRHSALQNQRRCQRRRSTRQPKSSRHSVFSDDISNDPRGSCFPRLRRRTTEDGGRSDRAAVTHPCRTQPHDRAPQYTATHVARPFPSPPAVRRTSREQPMAGLDQRARGHTSISRADALVVPTPRRCGVPRKPPGGACRGDRDRRHS